jgi:hypothetical protein
MDESALQTRLQRIERRQRLTLWLLAGVYAVGGLWLLVREVPAVSGWHAGVGAVAVGVFAAVVGIARRRRASG